VGGDAPGRGRARFVSDIVTESGLIDRGTDPETIERMRRHAYHATDDGEWYLERERADELLEMDRLGLL
jgi:hypothetical protein